jgi:hypothetical protein
MNRLSVAALGAALCIVAARAAFAASIAPSTLVADPAQYDGKSVSVTGTVKAYQHNSTPMGPVAGYQLCDPKCIVVIDKTNATHADGDKVTAAGVFHASFKAPQRTFTNAVIVSK